MMKRCKDCIWYKEAWDVFRQCYDDVITDDTDEHHFCIMYEGYIPQGIVEDRQLCKYYIEKTTDPTE